MRSPVRSRSGPPTSAHGSARRLPTVARSAKVGPLAPNELRLASRPPGFRLARICQANQMLLIVPTERTINAVNVKRFRTSGGPYTHSRNKPLRSLTATGVRLSIERPRPLMCARRSSVGGIHVPRISVGSSTHGCPRLRSMPGRRVARAKAGLTAVCRRDPVSGRPIPPKAWPRASRADRTWFCERRVSFDNRRPCFQR
jgi:hypothetical protein